MYSQKPLTRRRIATLPLPSNFQSHSLSLSTETANDAASLSLRSRLLLPSPAESHRRQRWRRRRRGFHRRLLQALRDHNPGLRIHTASCVVHPGLPLLASRLQSSRPRLARLHQSKPSPSLLLYLVLSLTVLLVHYR